MEFKASMDKTTKLITTFVIFILIVVMILPFISIPKPLNILFPLFSALIPLIIFLIPILYKPKFYSIEVNQVIIHRTMNDIKLLKSEIISVGQLEKEKLKGTIRTFGVGGLFGYFGKFYNNKIGVMTLYATRRSNYVLIKTSANKKIILTPDNPEDFVKEFYKM